MGALNKGQRVAERYVLLSRISDNRFAQSWLARDADGRGEIVVKLAAEGPEASSAAAMLDNEFDIGSRLNHPSIVRYFEKGTHDGRAFVTREFCSGGPAVPMRGRPWQQILPAMAQIADALAEVHQAGLVHRDIKPANVLLAADGRAKLNDFGVASLAGEQGLRRGGSPESTSPQQQNGDAPSPADDAYSFGVMLVDLLGASMSPQGSVTDWPRETPDTLRTLIAQLVHIDPDARPLDLSQVARQLEAIVDSDRNATLPPEALNEPSLSAAIIEPVVPEDSDSAPPLTEIDPGSRRGVSQTAGVIALSLVILLGLGGIFVLRTLEPPQVAPSTSATPAGAQTDASDVATVEGGAQRTREGVEPWQLAQEARLRSLAEDELEGLLEKQFTLDDRRIEVWAAEEYEQATQMAIDGDRAFRREDFQAAYDQYAAGNALLGDLVARSERLVGDTLTAATASIEAGDSAKAIERYELVLKVEPENTAAKSGLDRARRLDEVLALVEKASEVEQYGDPSDALVLYQQAAELDPAWSDATNGVRRMNRALTGERFRTAMSDGYAALQGGRYEAARAAFERADRIRGGTTDVRDALDQLALARRSSSVSELRERAAALEQAEDFTGALAVYREARALDPNLGFAREGETRNAERVELLQTINGYVSDPDRLVSDSVYDAASTALERAQNVANPGRALTTAAARLQAQLVTSRIIVNVTLTSDSLTDVLVYRVGRLGRFGERALELRPGRYTAVGSRDGFRDVRREFRVGPDGVDGAVDVRCTERL